MSRERVRQIEVRAFEKVQRAVKSRIEQHGHTHKQKRPNSVEQEEEGQRHFGDTSHRH